VTKIVATIAMNLAAPKGAVKLKLLFSKAASAAVSAADISPM